MIYFNLIGFAFITIAYVVGWLVAWLVGGSADFLFGFKNSIPAQVAQCLLLIGIDAVYRIKTNEGSLWALFHPRKGGHISFIPIWIFGVIFSITMFVPLHGRTHTGGGNFASAQPKNPQSAPLEPTVQQQQPTSAQPVQPSRASQVAVTPTGPPVLRSIMWIPTRPSAQLDNNWAFEGDRVRGYKVTKISHDSVDLLTPEGASLKLVLAAQVAGK
jgi:hypothetical protein